MSDFEFPAGDNTNDDLNDDVLFESESGEVDFVPDPSVVAFLDQKTAEARELQEQFGKTYGFEHECHCDRDYSKGNIVEVTECFAGMIVDSLETCGRLNAENLALREMLHQLFKFQEALNETEADVAEGEGIPAVDSTS